MLHVNVVTDSNKQTHPVPQDFGGEILNSKPPSTNFIAPSYTSLRDIDEAIDEFIMISSSTQEQLQAGKVIVPSEANMSSPLLPLFDSDTMTKQLKSHSTTH